MSQDGQTHFKNLARNAVSFKSMSDHFGRLCIKGLILGEKKNSFMMEVPII